MKQIQKMMGFSIWPAFYWKFMFKFGCPFFILVILYMVANNLTPLKYNDYTYPAYAEYAGWCITLASVIMIPIFSIHELINVFLGKKTLKVKG